MSTGPRRLLPLLLSMLSVVLAAPAQADADEHGVDVIVGRADADASGGWPVVLWVLDGERSQLIVRAPREQLATLPGRPWQAMDGAALLNLERYAAPRLVRRWDLDPCPTQLLWEPHPKPIVHVAARRDALEHDRCGAADCSDRAWRIAMPAEPVLPLRWLMPGLAAQQPQWLVLHVVSPHEALRLDGLPVLDAPPDLRISAPWRWVELPWAASARFPDIHAAMLEHAAAAQGLAQASVLMRSDTQSIQPLRFASRWTDSDAYRQALGLSEASVQRDHIVRLLLRLQPGDRPAELRLQPVDRRSSSTVRPLHASQPLPRSLDSCSRDLDVMDCQAACTRHVGELRQSWASQFGPRGAQAAMPAEEVMQLCLPACEGQKRAVAASMERRLEAVPERQLEAWRWVETLTGRPAAAWQAR
jgi:hypothetical protein